MINSYKPQKNYYTEVFMPLKSFGKIWERMAQEQLIKKSDNTLKLLSECNDYRYDFILSNDMKYEVKASPKAIETGQFYIEFLQFNKPSGISITESDYYILILPKIKPLYIQILTLELQFLIKTEQFDDVIYGSLWNNYTAGYLFNVDLLVGSGEIIN